MGQLCIWSCFHKFSSSQRRGRTEDRWRSCSQNAHFDMCCCVALGGRPTVCMWEDAPVGKLNVGGGIKMYRIYFWCQPSCYRGNCPSIHWTENQTNPPPPLFFIYLFLPQRAWSWAAGGRGGQGVGMKSGEGNLPVDETVQKWRNVACYFIQLFMKFSFFTVQHKHRLYK